MRVFFKAINKEAKPQTQKSPGFWLSVYNWRGVVRIYSFTNFENKESYL